MAGSIERVTSALVAAAKSLGPQAVSVVHVAPSRVTVNPPEVVVHFEAPKPVAPVAIRLEIDPETGVRVFVSELEWARPRQSRRGKAGEYVRKPARSRCGAHCGVTCHECRFWLPRLRALELGGCAPGLLLGHGSEITRETNLRKECSDGGT